MYHKKKNLNLKIIITVIRLEKLKETINTTIIDVRNLFGLKKKKTKKLKIHNYRYILKIYNYSYRY